MTIHKHVLKGCSPTPLASYLKALGILRIVSEQTDSSCRGAWIDDRFVLATELDKEALEEFVLDEYAPTPIFNPWGGRSGFYDSKSETSSRAYLKQILEADNPRFESFQTQISTVRRAVADQGKEKPKDKEGQFLLLANINNRLRGSAENWIPSCAPLGPNSGDSYKPPLLGTGGNEGSGSYTSAFFRAVVECLIERTWDKGLIEAFWRDPSQSLWKGSFGQFIPDSNGNAWDLLFAFEGAQMINSNVARRLASQRSQTLCSPFSVSTGATGRGSLSYHDEYFVKQGQLYEGRGEQWFPIWKSFANSKEIRTLFNEGRISTKKQKPSPLDFVSAVARMALPKGIESFVRYGYLQRNNCATHFAVPIGRVPVTRKPYVRIIDDIAPWMDRLHREARSRTASTRIVTVERVLADAVFDALTHDESAFRWQAILKAAVLVERLQSVGGARSVGPIPKLSPEWLTACDDGTPLFRLAVALGSAAARHTASGYAVDRLRHHFLSLDRSGWRLGKEENARDVRVVAFGRDPISDLIAIMERRTLESASREGRHPQVKAAPGAGATLSDIAVWIDGCVDTAQCVDLGRAFMAVDWAKWQSTTRGDDHSSEDDPPPDAWGLLRLNTLPWPLSEELNIPCDPAIIRRLKTGSSEAFRIALQRLGSHGIRTPLRHTVFDQDTIRRMAAALTFPIHRKTAARLLRQIQP